MQLPVVNHPEYVAKINDNSIFPIKKFSALADYLLQKNIDSCYTGCFRNNKENWKTLPFVTETPIMIMTIGKGKVYTWQDPENLRPTLDEIVSIVK